MADDVVGYHTQRLETLRTNRGTWEAQWEEAAERLVPAHKNTFFGRNYGTSWQAGQKNTEKMYDATAALALQRFTAVFESIATPKNQLWHRLVPTDPQLRKNRQVRKYMDQLNQLLSQHRYRPTANFVGQIQKSYMSYGAYGNGTLFVDEHQQRTGLRYKNLHLGETYYDENHQGTVDTMYRVFSLKPRQILQQFDEKDVPDSIKDAAKNANTAEQDKEILHVITPRAEFDPQRRDGKGMPIASLYILKETNDKLSEGGYRTWPAPVMRYMQFVNETYGRGPAQLALPAIKVLNAEKKTVLKQGHRVVDPVLLAYDDGATGAFNMRSGAFNAGAVNAQGRPLVHPLPTGNIAVGQELMNDERAVINDAFLITLFQILVESHTMTATEVLERAREKGMILAPTAGRLESEFLGPLIERELDVLDSLGLLPAPPPILLEAGAEFTIEYDNPMARMVRAEDASGFMRSLQFALDVFNATGNPEPLDWFDFDTAVPAIQEIHGAPTEWTTTMEQVQQVRAQRAQEAQEQKAIDAAPAVASLAKTQEGGQ